MELNKETPSTIFLLSPALGNFSLPGITPKFFALLNLFHAILAILGPKKKKMVPHMVVFGRYYDYTLLEFERSNESLADFIRGSAEIFFSLPISNCIYHPFLAKKSVLPEDLIYYFSYYYVTLPAFIEDEYARVELAFTRAFYVALRYGDIRVIPPSIFDDDWWKWY